VFCASRQTIRRGRTAYRLAFPTLFIFTFAVLAGSPHLARSAQEEYHLGAGDVVWVLVWKEPDLSQTVVIRPDGKVSLPLIGEFPAEGRTARELESAIAAKLRDYIRDPVVNVIVKEINSSKIYVIGKVRKPDAYLVRGSITVVEAIAMAGGLREDSRGNKVIILRNGKGNSSYKQRIELNLKRMMTDEQSGQVRLQASDTVYVPD